MEKLDNSKKLGKVYILAKKDKPDCITWEELFVLLDKVKVINLD